MSEIRLVIDDYAAPWAETYCTVQSFKRQQGGVTHVPVKYGVSTDFPGVVTLTTSDGVSHSVTSGTEITVWLDEGGLSVKADASGVTLSNGTYYLFLLQDESTLELQVFIDVDLTYYAMPSLGVAIGNTPSPVTVAEYSCGSPTLYELITAGTDFLFSRTYSQYFPAFMVSVADGRLDPQRNQYVAGPLHASEMFFDLRQCFRLSFADTASVGSLRFRNAQTQEEEVWPVTLPFSEVAHFSAQVDEDTLTVTSDWGEVVCDDWRQLDSLPSFTVRAQISVLNISQGYSAIHYGVATNQAGVVLDFSEGNKQASPLFSSLEEGESPLLSFSPIDLSSAPRPLVVNAVLRLGTRSLTQRLMIIN